MALNSVAQTAGLFKMFVIIHFLELTILLIYIIVSTCCKKKRSKQRSQSSNSTLSSESDNEENIMNKVDLGAEKDEECSFNVRGRVQEPNPVYGVGQYPVLAATDDGTGLVCNMQSSFSKKAKNHYINGNAKQLLKERFDLAIEFIQQNASSLKINFPENKFMLHISPSVIEKNGFSGGAAIVTCLLSQILGRPAKKDTAIIGGIFVNGNIEHVLGLPDKLCAAKRNGIKMVILPNNMRKDFEQLNEEETKGIIIEFVDNYFDAIRLLFP
ncbi:Lon proteolytic domain-containing protein [Meloidogyne graminicola]|uniref:Lon proteolytic domain-containing protein n=1 Tax=Meloidogyne graminicola TaxID=189291 RepID=A0A8S9ZG99_9BILA|nr:Lon proteolytic domain-containing protein [Meloidogyne graminicola]